jgi:hypothetical protein
MGSSSRLIEPINVAPNQLQSKTFLTIAVPRQKSDLVAHLHTFHSTSPVPDSKFKDVSALEDFLCISSVFHFNRESPRCCYARLRLQ